MHSDPWILHQLHNTMIRFTTGHGPYEKSEPTYQLSEVLSPGFVGGLLLILLQLLYLLNAVIWAFSYIAGPGFAIGADTLVAPTGVQLGTVPSLPMLGALPESGPVPAWMMAFAPLPMDS